MTTSKANAIARQIAKELFSDCSGRMVTCLRFEFDGKQDGSGWGYTGVEELIAGKLITATKDTEKAARQQ